MKLKSKLYDLTIPTLQPRLVNQPLEKELTADAEAPLTVLADVPPADVLPQSHHKRSRTFPLSRGDFSSIQAQIKYICKAVEAVAANIGSAFENKAHVSTSGLAVPEEGDSRQRNFFILIDIIDKDHQIASEIISSTRSLVDKLGLFESGPEVLVHIVVKSAHFPESPIFIKKDNIAPAAPSILKSACLAEAGLLSFDKVVRQEIAIDSISNRGQPDEESLFVTVLLQTLESNKQSLVLCSRRNVAALFRRHLEKRPYVESFANTIGLRDVSPEEIAAKYIAYDSAVHQAAFRSLAAAEEAYDQLTDSIKVILFKLKETHPSSRCYTLSKQFFCIALAIENSIAREKKRAVDFLLAIVSGTCNITLHNICSTWLVDEHCLDSAQRELAVKRCAPVIRAHKLQTTASLLAINQRYASTFQLHDISLADGICNICITPCRLTILRPYSEAELEERNIADNVLANLANLQLTEVREYTEKILPLDFIYRDQEVTEQKNHNTVKESVKKLSYTLAYHQRIQRSDWNTPHRGLRPIDEKLGKSTTFAKEQIHFLESELTLSIAAGSKNDRTESTCTRSLTDIISNLIGYSPYAGTVDIDTEKFFRSLQQIVCSEIVTATRSDFGILSALPDASEQAATLKRQLSATEELGKTVIAAQNTDSNFSPHCTVLLLAIHDWLYTKVSISQNKLREIEEFYAEGDCSYKVLNVDLVEKELWDDQLLLSSALAGLRTDAADTPNRLVELEFQTWLRNPGSIQLPLAQEQDLPYEPVSPKETPAPVARPLLEEVVEAIRHAVLNAPCQAPVLQDSLIEEIPTTLQGLARQNGERNLTSGLEPEISALASISEVTPTELGQPQAVPESESFSLTAVATAINEQPALARTESYRYENVPSSQRQKDRKRKRSGSHDYTDAECW